MDPAEKVLTYVCGILIGALLAVVPHLRHWWRMMRSGITVAGTVTRVGRNLEGHPWVVVEDRVGSAMHQVWLYRHTARFGDAVPLRVDPARPEQVLVRGSVGQWGVALAFVLILGAPCLCGTILMVWLIDDLQHT